MSFSSQNCHFHPFAGQASIFQKMDSTIHWINHYPVDKYEENQLRYPVDRDNAIIHLLNNWGLRKLQDKTDKITEILACMQMSEKSPTFSVHFLHVIKKVGDLCTQATEILHRRILFS